LRIEIEIEIEIEIDRLSTRVLGREPEPLDIDVDFDLDFDFDSEGAVTFCRPCRPVPSSRLLQQGKGDTGPAAGRRHGSTQRALF
jgi:hypothetical protein